MIVILLFDFVRKYNLGFVNCNRSYDVSGSILIAVTIFLNKIGNDGLNLRFSGLLFDCLE